MEKYHIQGRVAWATEIVLEAGSPRSSLKDETQGRVVSPLQSADSWHLLPPLESSVCSPLCHCLFL